MMIFCIKEFIGNYFEKMTSIPKGKKRFPLTEDGPSSLCPLLFPMIITFTKHLFILKKCLFHINFFVLYNTVKQLTYDTTLTDVVMELGVKSYKLLVIDLELELKAIFYAFLTMLKIHLWELFAIGMHNV